MSVNLIWEEKPMRMKIVVVTLVLALIVVSGIVSAQGPRGGMGMGKMSGGCPMGLGMGQRLMDQLGLTQDQQTKLKQLHTDYLSATQSTREQLRTKMQELAQLWSSDATADQLKAKMAEIDPLRAELRDAGIDFAIQVRSMLTSEQRTKLQQMIKEKTEDGMGMCWGLGACMGCPMPAGKGSGPMMQCPLGANCPLSNQ